MAQVSGQSCGHAPKNVLRAGCSFMCAPPHLGRPHCYFCGSTTSRSVPVPHLVVDSQHLRMVRTVPHLVVDGQDLRMVRTEGVEPSLPCGNRILSPVCLPVPPRPLMPDAPARAHASRTRPAPTLGGERGLLLGLRGAGE